MRAYSSIGVTYIWTTRAKYPCRRFPWSSLVIPGHPWSSLVIPDHPWSSLVIFDHHAYRGHPGLHDRHAHARAAGNDYDDADGAFEYAAHTGDVLSEHAVH